MGVAVIQAVARGYEGSLVAGVRDSLRWSLGIIILALCVSGYYFINDNLSLALSFLVVAALSPIIASTSLFSSYLNGKKLFSSLTLFTIIRQVIIACVLVLTILFTQNPLLIVFAYFLSDSITCTILFLITKIKFVKNTNVDPTTLTYSKHLSIMEIVKIISTQADKILIFSTLGAGPLAVYTIAMAPISQLKGIDQIVANLAFPKFSQRSFHELQQTLLTKVMFLTAAMGVIAAAYIFSAPYIFSVLFSQYMESVIYSQVYTISLLVIPSVLFVKALTAHKKTKQQYILKIVTPLLKIILLIILLPLYGIWGALIALISTEIVWMFLSIYLFYKRDNVRFTEA
jgi:O-antigen/teichoic acid export membrane protein